ncbi:MAG: hypothetical protein JRE38_06825 [Deltaproteobacteria bacterium]|nr:hypothetical protein [Deltaproteobacteria bacterium]MBW2577766.1 hypothetical protein [Deltaproteobacteria bacterium]MBW2693049.1 hypothetical protein [Deltaproteobacteria bacterium]
MKNEIRIIGVGLAAMAGILLVSSSAWAQAEETPIQGRWLDCQNLVEPEREWVDEDGIEHRRNALYSCRHRGSLRGLEKGWASSERNPGVWVSERGYYSYTGTILGEQGPGVARYTLECSRVEGAMTCLEEHVMHPYGGGLVKFSGTWNPGGPRTYTGTFLDTPGGGKRNGPRSK